MYEGIKAEAAQAASEIMHYVNAHGSSKGAAELAEALCREHPTIQQAFMRVAIAFIERQAAEHNHDLRTEATVQLAKQIVALPGWERAKYLPLI